MHLGGSYIGWDPLGNFSNSLIGGLSVWVVAEIYHGSWVTHRTPRRVRESCHKATYNSVHFKSEKALLNL